MTNRKRKKKGGACVQELLGFKGFSEYGLHTTNGEFLFYQVAPTNISVLSAVSIESKIKQLMVVLSAICDLELICTDSAECTDENRAYLSERLEQEQNPSVRTIIEKDLSFFGEVQTEMANARQFLFAVRLRNLKPHQVFERCNSMEKIISEQGFDCHRLRKNQIKRFLALYFDVSAVGERMPDTDGGQYFEERKDTK